MICLIKHDDSFRSPSVNHQNIPILMPIIMNKIEGKKIIIFVKENIKFVRRFVLRVMIM